MSICYINFLCLFSLSFLMVTMSLFFIMDDLVIFFEWEVISINTTSILMTLLFDWKSLVFMGFVLFISSLVVLYSSYYMEGDININRFIYLVFMFVVSMMFLIISPNMISILLGWDGLGLISYCLVIYYQNVKSYNAGMLTALSNRVGDISLLFSISWMLNFGSWNYIFILDYCKMDYNMMVVMFLVLLAAFTKSAQIPFSSWLPAAMAAPTPVSALVHSSTLVTAGVYLLIRFSPCFNTSLFYILMFFSTVTMFMAGLGANFEYDLKKIIALSTLSQLGLMMSVLGLGYFNLAFFHLLMHALFKALLFMCAGVIIHCMSDAQDIRYMGGLSLQMPFVSSCLMVSNFSLCGMPFLAGFYSSDLLLDISSMSYLNFFSFVLLYLSTGLTVCYSFRLFYYVMCGDFNLSPFFFLDEKNNSMVYSMSLLLLCVVFGGSMFSWLLFPEPMLIMLPLHMKSMVILVSLSGMLMGYLMSMMNLYSMLYSMNFMFGFHFLGSMWFMPYMSTYGTSYYPLYLGFNSFKVCDMGWSEYFGGQGLYYLLMLMGSVNYLLQFNNLKMFLTMFILLFMFFMLMGLISL
uniref:NADH dehydrogenase subunit 5 n=1 Tax=Sorineuchora nigra TaxID=1928794 RepID=UPI0027A3FB72|nr:NADH dehydrogenase subunit 5 [Sorineuchora nigra]WGO57633.1 NADH dehydrogenase subunit 5 [Sorineuchora nigra]